MKGVVLAGGTGSRLNPLTRVTNKHLLPVYDKPMVNYPIQTLVNAGIHEILLVTGGKNAGDFLRLLGNGRDFGLKHLNYTYQEGEGGIAEALGLAEFFAGDEPICVVLGRRSSIRSSYKSLNNSRPGSIRSAKFERRSNAIWPRPGRNFQRAWQRLWLRANSTPCMRSVCWKLRLHPRRAARRPAEPRLGAPPARRDPRRLRGAEARLAAAAERHRPGRQGARRDPCALSSSPAGRSRRPRASTLWRPIAARDCSLQRCWCSTLSSCSRRALRSSSRCSQRC